MRYLVQNISTNTTLYPASVNGSLCTMLHPGDTLSIDAKAKDELLLSYPEFINVIGTSYDPHSSVTVNATIGVNWTLVDIGYYYGTISVKADIGTMQYSFSGFMAPNTAPPINSIGTLTVGEEVTLFITTKPERYVYVKGPGDIQITGS